MNLFDDINLNIPRMEQQRYEKIKKSGKYMELDVLIGSDNEDLGDGFIVKSPVVSTTIKGVGAKEVGCMYMTLHELIKSLEKEFPLECFVAKLSMRAEHDGAVSIEKFKIEEE